MKKKLLVVMGLLMSGTLMSQASVADEWDIPVADASGRVGALMPYTRYDSEAASLGGGATMRTSHKWDRMNIASQASRQSYIELPSAGSYAEWTMNTVTDGVTLRFTLPDSGDGMGLNGSLDVYVNGRKTKTVDLTSYYMYQYFASGNPSDSNDGGAAAFAFDEVHFTLSTPLKAGDRIRIQSSGDNGLTYGVDFIETESIPAEIERPEGAVSVTDFGAVADDGQDDLEAFKKALAAADAGSKVLYIPAGTWHLSSIWYVFGSDVKITGAGIWYTNLKFTNPNTFGGGISGGNGSNGPDGYCSNMEICNFYMNSSLRSRYNQQAVYKCFMDVFKGGSVIHDIWEDHFECGFWIADYNGAMDYSDGLKIVNCRIRNNLADGVNFCKGTSNATVYNCNIRNNGDDGLAMWNDTGNAKDESGNVFAYNTIDFIWRAGGIAIYGGDGHKVYNNYICDMYLASGIHLNTTFPGDKFVNTRNISFDNNILVRCGTNADSWREDLAAIDLKENVRNVTFTNTQIYDSPFDAIRILNGPENIVFRQTKILGSALSGETDRYSTWEHSCAAIRLQNENIIFQDTKIANVSDDKVGNNSTWPLWTDNNGELAKSVGYEYLSDAAYKVPDYPAADNSQAGGIVNPLDGITGYDVALQGLRWENGDGKTDIKEGDSVTFKAAITNISKVDIPAGVRIGLQVKVDGKLVFVGTGYKEGLKAGQSVIINTVSSWTATPGGHEIVAVADYQNRLPDEVSKENNLRTKHFNVIETETSGSYTAVTGGYDLYVTKVSCDRKRIDAGDAVIFSAVVVNAGDRDIPAGTVIGAQFQVDGNTSAITWSDTYKDGLKAHSFVTLTANGGSNGSNKWMATNGKHVITAWVDDVNRLSGEVNEANNKTDITLDIPHAAVQYIENPDAPDDLDHPGQTEEPVPATGETIRLNGSSVTYSSAHQLDFTGVDGLKAYIVTGYVEKNGEVSVKLTEADVVPANTGLVLYGMAGREYKVSYSDARAVYSNLLKAVVEPMTVQPAENGYVNLCMIDGNFYMFSRPMDFSGNKAYLQLPSFLFASGAKKVTVLFDETTGIDDVHAETMASGAYYDLQGRFMGTSRSGLRKGIYIHNGKKIVIN
ncbi:MAG: sugar-binding protein [Prevotella sp.]|nr:sugar-binding protein [Prevotella sp.]